MDTALFQEPRRRTFALADGEMAALDFGDKGRPVQAVFLHANGFNATTYRSILGPLSMSMRLLALDLRGHGSSTLPADPAKPRRSWNLFRDDLLAVLDQLEGPPVVLAGHSMGATAALLAAAIAPAKAKALLMFEPVVLPRFAAFAASLPWTAGKAFIHLHLARTAARRRSVWDNPSDVFRSYQGRGAFRTWPEIVLADYLAGGLKARDDGKVELACAPAWEAANFAAQDNPVRRALRRLACPALIYKAERGSTCAISRGRVPVETVPGTTHFLPMERPDLVREALLDAVGT